MDNDVLLRIKNSSKEIIVSEFVVSSYTVNIEEKLEISTANTYNNTGIPLEVQSEINIPLDIIKGNSSMRVIVYYLKENFDMNFKSISELLNRDQRTIWSSYHKASNIQSYPASKYSFPVDILRSRRLSVLESIVFYLRNELALTFNEIADELGKNYRTIWTVYRRALMKIQ
jgi:hypothetical protein